MNKSFETLWSREERYLINKLRSDYLFKQEDDQPERSKREDASILITHPMPKEVKKYL